MGVAPGDTSGCGRDEIAKRLVGAEDSVQSVRGGDKLLPLGAQIQGIRNASVETLHDMTSTWFLAILEWSFPFSVQ